MRHRAINDLDSGLNRQVILVLACCAVTAPQSRLVTAYGRSPEDESFDDWLAPITAKNWIADAQITPDCLATKEQCSVYLSGISLLSPEGDICLPVCVSHSGKTTLVLNSPDGRHMPAGVRKPPVRMLKWFLARRAAH